MIDQTRSGLNLMMMTIYKKFPHTLEMVTSDSWNYKYPKGAAFALVTKKIVLATSKKVDDAYGDRNLICSQND